MVFTDERREFLLGMLSENQMSQEEFAAALKRKVRKGIFHMKPASTTVDGSDGPTNIYSLTDADSLYVTWYNVDNPSDTRGAKGENNRISVNVNGFTSKKGKLQVELSRGRAFFDKLRKKTASPQRILDYLADYLEKQAEKETR